MTPAALQITARGGPAHAIRFSTASGAASYYDAASSGNDVDFGAWRSGHFEDYHFSGTTRSLVLGRLRREVRNNPYLAGLVAKYPEAIGHTSLRSRTSGAPYNQAKELFWYRWGKRCGADGRSLRKLERITISELLIAGEIFFALLANGRIQPIASEFCGSPGGTTRFGEREINGIVYDANNQPVAYRFGKLTRSGGIQFTGTDAELVQARHVIHVYDADRVLMGRGLPWLLASVKTARDLYEITRSKTKQIKDANSLSGFVKRATGAPSLFEGLKPAEATVEGETVEDRLKKPADPVPDSGTKTIELKPGIFVELNEGEEIQSLVSEYHAEDYKELIMLMLHALSSPVGLPVELWFSGLGDVNYSGFKGLGVQWKSRREYVCDFLEESFLEPLQTWRITKARDEGELIDFKTGKRIDNPDSDEDLVEWGWKRAAVLDDEKGAKANQVRLMTGESSHADVWADNGEFPEEVLRKRRQTYIQLLIASGQLEEGGDHAKVIVPVGYLLRNELLGTTTYPYLPDGTGKPDTPEIDPATGKPFEEDDEIDDDAPAAGAAA